MLASAKRICQITTVHPRYDVRIFNKICLSLVSDYQVNLIVADGRGDEVINNVTIFDVGRGNSSRIKRMLFTTRSAYRKAMELDCEVFHFHDPEFLFFGYKLTRKGKYVIYDAHEDLPRQIFGKHYIKTFLKPVISKTVEIFENFISKYFYAIVTATPKIKDRFSRINSRTVAVCNYVITEEFLPNINYSERAKKICYIGGISKVRGINELMSSLDFIDPDFTLELAGEIEDLRLESELLSNKNWGRVRYYGFVGRNEIKLILKSSRIGILTLYPIPNHLDSLPIKLFEYMAAGIPVIASDFPLWREIVEGNNCGICVNPKDPEDISNAINYLLMNQDVAETMGKNGVKAASDKFNWDSEKEKLLTLYSSLFQ